MHNWKQTHQAGAAAFQACVYYVQICRFASYLFEHTPFLAKEFKLLARSLALTAQCCRQKLQTWYWNRHRMDIYSLHYSKTFSPAQMSEDARWCEKDRSALFPFQRSRCLSLGWTTRPVIQLQSKDPARAASAHTGRNVIFDARQTASHFGMAVACCLVFASSGSLLPRLFGEWFREASTRILYQSIIALEWSRSSQVYPHGVSFSLTQV